MTEPVVLTLNPGSSSMKAAVFTGARAVSIAIDRLGTTHAGLTVTADGSSTARSFTGGIGAAVEAIAAELRNRGLDPVAVGHRVVHGGPKHYQPTMVDDDLLADLHDVLPLAPLHLPGDLDSIEHARRAWPAAQQVACFDTGFHHDLPEVSRRLPVPERVAGLGVRRYGFHGLSIQSVLHARPDLDHVVIAHLGSGCSVTAVSEGKSRHTTMSLTPTGGMVSATRTGDLDPEIVLFLIEQHGYTVEEVRSEFDHDAGLAGMAGGRHDVRDLLAASDEEARLALDVFAQSAAMSIAACATHLPRWRHLVFTGGIGENAEGLRGQICSALLALRTSTAARSDDSVADLRATQLEVVTVTADEEGVIDRETRRVCGLQPGRTLAT